MKNVEALDAATLAFHANEAPVYAASGPETAVTMRRAR
jgi:hypothetical protein